MNTFTYSDINIKLINALLKLTEVQENYTDSLKEINKFNQKINDLEKKVDENKRLSSTSKKNIFLNSFFYLVSFFYLIISPSFFVSILF